MKAKKPSLRILVTPLVLLALFGLCLTAIGFYLLFMNPDEPEYRMKSIGIELPELAERR